MKFDLQFFGCGGSNSTFGKIPGEALRQAVPDIKNWNISKKWEAKTDYSEEIKEIHKLLDEGKKAEAKKIFDSVEVEWRGREWKRYRQYSKIDTKVFKTLSDEEEM